MVIEVDSSINVSVFTGEALCNHIHMLLKANTRWQEQAGDQHRDGLAISCGHAAQYMATIGAINGSGSNVDLKLYVYHGFSSQDKGQPGCIIPGSGAAAQATMGELASAGCKLLQKVPSSVLSHLPVHY